MSDLARLSIWDDPAAKAILDPQGLLNPRVLIDP